MTRAGVTVYLQTMFVRPGDRGGGVGEALVRHVHVVLDARGVDTTLLHFAQLNPLSAPFWNRWATVRCGPDGRCGRPPRCGEAEC